jgi:ribonuclease VapC
MTLDSSALIAILFAEAGHLDLIDRILSANSVRVAAPTLVETSMVLAGRRRKPAVGEVDALVHELGVTVVPFGEREWHAAVEAFLRFGRGATRRRSTSATVWPMRPPSSRTIPCCLLATISHRPT